jgi:MFS family permease
MKDFIVLLKNKNYTRLWLSQILSQITVNILSFLILIRLFDNTGSTIATSLVWVAYAIPAIIVGPIAAVTADLLDRRKVLIFTNLGQTITIILYALLYQKFLFLSYGVVFMYSLINQFYVPSEAASLPTFVNKNNLPQANSLFFLTQQVALALGFVFAGLLYNLVPFGLAVAVAAATMFLAFLNVIPLPKQKQLEKLPQSFEKRFMIFFKELMEGYSFIKGNKKILFPFFLLIGLQISLSIIVISLPVIATDIVKIKPSLSSLVIVIPGAIGALVGSYVVSRLLSMKKRKKKIIENCMAILSVCVFSLSIFVPVLPFWISRTLAIGSFVIIGATYAGCLIPSLTYLQEKTPSGLMGRVFGNIWFITTLCTVLPVLFSATITEIFGIKLMIGFIGLIGISGYLLARFYNKIQIKFQTYGK